VGLWGGIYFVEKDTSPYAQNMHCYWWVVC